MQFEHAQLPTAVQQLREQLRQGTKSGRLHWRYGIMAEALEVRSPVYSRICC